eukprot:CAMPEP_0119558424 /NCGR_PEP_ID=MMETSP1352-20130426/10774_1 /TAXON_ID=265584 /ORGANISM="Stauroneis constricta, Strain CCMP1120" /LENGTH=492 /DNA_ID=CAMNT_0007605781 /DNA_START=76 /DNA_END=1554 /DNA_ORIENTATION=+
MSPKKRFLTRRRMDQDGVETTAASTASTAPASDARKHQRRNASKNADVHRNDDDTDYDAGDENNNSSSSRKKHRPTSPSSSTSTLQLSSSLSPPPPKPSVKRYKKRGRKPKQQQQQQSSPSAATTTAEITPGRRRSSRGNSSLSELARDIVVHRKNVVFITGAGISVASGVRPFRGKSGVWTQVIWTTATREAFRKNPLDWYNQFWLPFLEMPNNPKPNAGHIALTTLLAAYSNIDMITQNVDGLHPPSDRLIEAHGRLGLFKCIPEEDSDTDSDSDDDSDRLVHLGHRRKHRNASKHINSGNDHCPYRKSKSLTVDQLLPRRTSVAFSRKKSTIREAPRCPCCGNAIAPQALLFDEGYHAHEFYQFERMEDILAKADVLVFCGTSFAVRLTVVALDHARDMSLPVYNFNTQDLLQPSLRLNAENVTGKSEETLPALVAACREMERTFKKDAGGTAMPSTTTAVAAATTTTTTASAPAAAAASSSAPIFVGS